MTEEELFEIMKKEYPQNEEVSFMLGIDHWSHTQGVGETTSYRLSMVPGGKEDCHIIYSKHSWDELHLMYLDWRREQDA